MSTTADSSLIVALYLAEVNSAVADAACAAVAPPILLTAWHRVEIANAFQRGVLQGRITSTQADQLWQDFSADVTAGRFQTTAIDHAATLTRTLDLTQKHTAAIGTRTLDLLHIAAALEWGTDTLLSFDDRQRQAAQAEGMNVLPAALT